MPIRLLLNENFGFFYSLLLGYMFICIWKCKILWQNLLLFMKSVVKDYDKGP